MATQKLQPPTTTAILKLQYLGLKTLQYCQRTKLGKERQIFMTEVVEVWHQLNKGTTAEETLLSAMII
jgi:hypothetical protein